MILVSFPVVDQKQILLYWRNHFKKLVGNTLCVSRRTFWRNCFERNFNNTFAHRAKIFCNYQDFFLNVLENCIHYFHAKNSWNFIPIRNFHYFLSFLGIEQKQFVFQAKILLQSCQNWLIDGQRYFLWRNILFEEFRSF